MRKKTHYENIKPNLEPYFFIPARTKVTELIIAVNIPIQLSRAANHL